MGRRLSEPKGSTDLRPIGEWGQGKHPIITLVAVVLLSAADTIFDALKDMREGRKRLGALGLPAPRLEEWVALYRDHRRLQDAVGLVLGMGEGGGSECMDELRKFGRLSAEQRRAEVGTISADEWRSAAAAATGLQEHLQAWLRGCLRDEPELPDTAVSRSFLYSAEARFLLLVWLPCWIEHQELPATLLNAARKGDVDALRDLLRIDKSILFDPGVSQIVHVESQRGDSGRWRRICAGVCDWPKGNLTRAKVRVTLAGLLRTVAAWMGERLTEPDIGELFDLIAQYRGVRTDQHVKRGETLARALHRSGRDWRAVLHPDKNHS